MGLVALGHVGSSQTRDQTHVYCIGRRIPNHWTTRVQGSLVDVFLMSLWEEVSSMSCYSGILIPMSSVVFFVWFLKVGG